MTQKLERFLQTLEVANDTTDLQQGSEALTEILGVDHVVYHWVSASGQQLGCGTYSPEWVQKYIDEDYLRVDPVVVGCFQRFHPVDWKRLDWSSKPARQFRKEAIAFGVGNQGYSIPIRGPNGQFALFTVSHNSDDDWWCDFTEANRRDLILLSHVFNQKALEFEGKAQQQGYVKNLSPREIDAMTLLAVGYNRAQVAQSLAISEHTLRVYIESARFKLGAANTTHAVARAMSQGFIVV